MRRAGALAEILRDPAERAFAGGLLDRLGAFRDDGAFLIFAHGAGDHPGGVGAVGGKCPTPAEALLDKLGVAGQRRGVGGDGGCQAVVVENLEYAEDPDPGTVFAPGVAADVRPEVTVGVAESGVAGGTLGRVQFPVP